MFYRLDAIFQHVISELNDVKIMAFETEDESLSEAGIGAVKAEHVEEDITSRYGMINVIKIFPSPYSCVQR